MKNAIRLLDRLDALIAALSGAGALALYVRNLAPDILYGDSAEFQTLAYTLGHTHSTGYPIYLLLARLVGFLPLNSPAWRVTLFSALMGAAAVAGVYLLGRMLTNSRAGAWLGCLALALSYTLWSQAVISEVYAPGAAFLAWILLLTLRWQQNPSQRAGALFAAALLAGLSLGIHATCAQAALPAAGLVPLWLAFQRADRAAWRRSLLAGAGGAALGTALWLAAFLYIDWHNPPSSFINTTLYPHRSIWGLAPADLDSASERIILTMNSIQWKDVLFAGGAEAARESLVSYLAGIAGREFSVWFMLLGFYGWWTMLARSPWRGGYLLVSYGVVLFYVLNYHPGDQYVFFLSTYVPLSAVAGAGAGALIEGAAQGRFLARRGWGRPAAALAALVLAVAGAVALAAPNFPTRLAALESGKASFVSEDYQFPVQNLREPRLLAHMHLIPLPDDALVLMEWRELYAAAYLAYVEGQKPQLRLVEAMPRGNDGKVSASLIELIQQTLAEGRPVYAAQRFNGLEAYFRLAAASNQYVELLQKK